MPSFIEVSGYKDGKKVVLWRCELPENPTPEQSQAAKEGLLKALEKPTEVHEPPPR